MPKRVGVLLSGCGAEDGSEIREAVLALLSIERASAEPLCAAPDAVQPHTVDHATCAVQSGQARKVLAEAARIARGPVRPLAALAPDDVDALVLPGGAGVETILSNHADKGQVCDVHPEVVRLLKAHLTSHRPVGVIGLASLLAARVLGPIAGVRLTLGPRGSLAAKHAAVMGADVRPCTVREIIVDQRALVVSTPGFTHEGARTHDVAVGVDKLVRAVLAFARDRGPSPEAR